MLRIFTYQDREVLAGLTWGPGKPPGLLQRTPLAAMSLAANDLALHWDDRTALVPQEPEYLGKASLLSSLTEALSEEDRIDHVIGSRVLYAYAADPVTADPVDDTTANDLAANDPRADDPAAGLYFAAVLVKGKPAIGAERLFDTREELITHIDLECRSNQIDHLATTADLATEVHSPVPVSLLTEQASGPASTTIRVEGKLTPHLPIWKIASGFGAVLLTLTAGMLLWFAVQPSKPIAQPLVAAVQTTFRDEVAFGQNCLAAFAGVWPLAPGWQLTSEGCATRTMRDPNLTGFAPAHPVAYRIYQVRGGFDAVIARQAAEAVYAQSAIDMLIRGNRLYSSFEIAVPMLKAATVPDQSAVMPQATPAALLAATEAVFLGLADSIVLDAGSGPNAGTGLGGASVRVMLKSSFEDIFERVQRIEGAEIARLSRNGETVTLEITPRQFVIVPMPRLPITGLTTTPVKIAAKTTATQTRPADRGMTVPADAPAIASSKPKTAANTQKEETI